MNLDALNWRINVVGKAVEVFNAKAGEKIVEKLHEAESLDESHKKAYMDGLSAGLDLARVDFDRITLDDLDEIFHDDEEEY